MRRHARGLLLLPVSMLLINRNIRLKIKSGKEILRQVSMLPCINEEKIIFHSLIYDFPENRNKFYKFRTGTENNQFLIHCP